MKKVLTVLAVALVAISLGSCVESSKKFKDVQAKNEELTKANQELQKNNADNQKVIDQVEAQINELRGAMGVLDLNDGDNGNAQGSFTEEIAKFKQVAEENRVRLDSLTDALEKSNKTNANLRAQIKKLQKNRADQEARIAEFEAQIAERDAQIANLNDMVANLNNDLENANKQIEDLNNQNLNKTNELNAVYYIGATKKELKNKGIILSTKNILKSEAPTEEFTKADKRDLNSIVFNTKKAVVLSNHPVDSYNLVKGVDENGKKIVTLEITNPEAFWNVTKYLVVLTK